MFLVGLLVVSGCDRDWSKSPSLQSEHSLSLESSSVYAPTLILVPKIVSSINKDVEFDIKFLHPEKEIDILNIDFEGDGVVDYMGYGIEQKPTNKYASEGNYVAYVFLRDNEGMEFESKIIVDISSEPRKTQYIYDEEIEPISYLREGDGILEKFVVIINGGFEERFWIDVNMLYNVLTQVYQLSPDHIFLLNHDGLNFNDENPNDMIDYDASIQSINEAFNDLAEIIDEDDQLFIFIDDHGAGYYGETSLYYGFSYNAIKVSENDDLDYLESEFKFRSLFTGGHYRKNHGMNEWAVYEYWSTNSDAYFFYRDEYLSNFHRLELENGSIVSNNDILIERIRDYLVGDSNKNGIIEEELGEFYDWDGDGNMPYDPDTETFDEGDWGNPDLIETFSRSSCPEEDYSDFEEERVTPYCIVDLGLDNISDIDINYNGLNWPNNLEIDGSDIDNEGLFDGIDINSDGDLVDWVSIDESVWVYPSGHLYDDDLKDLIYGLNPSNIFVFSQTCFSGGLVDDLSDNQTVIATATIEEDVSYNNDFIRDFITSLGEIGDWDDDGNNRVSVGEAFNYACEVNPFSYDPQYDDNGDQISHTCQIPNGEDGLLGLNLYFDFCSIEELWDEDLGCVECLTDADCPPRTFFCQSDGTCGSHIGPIEDTSEER